MSVEVYVDIKDFREMGLVTPHNDPKKKTAKISVPDISASVTV